MSTEPTATPCQKGWTPMMTKPDCSTAGMNRPTTVPKIVPYAAEDRRAADDHRGDDVEVGQRLPGDRGGAELGEREHRAEPARVPASA